MAAFDRICSGYAGLDDTGRMAVCGLPEEEACAR